MKTVLIQFDYSFSCWTSSYGHEIYFFDVSVVGAISVIGAAERNALDAAAINGGGDGGASRGSMLGALGGGSSLYQLADQLQ